MPELPVHHHDARAHIEVGSFEKHARNCPACATLVDDVEDLVEGSFDPRTQSHVVRVTKNWIVSWLPYGFNDRLLLTRKDAWPWFIAAGWCYDKGGTVLHGAYTFDPEVDWAPAGFKKTACDERACRAPIEYAADHLYDCFCTQPRDHAGNDHTCDHDREAA